MTRAIYEPGSSVYVHGSFTDPRNADNPVDPTTVTLEVLAPGATVYTAVVAGDINHVSTGEYEYVLALSLDGTYRWRWTGVLGEKVVVIPGACDSIEGRP